MDILLTNDDGIHAPGLWALYKALQSEHRIFVVAPDRERSAVGHGITLHHPLRAVKVSVNGGYQGWAVSGTPADCVKLAVVELLKKRPDIVISGINPGANVGVNLNYSGTVAAAKEAALYHLNAMAVSLRGAETFSFDAAAQCMARIVPTVPSMNLAPGTFLNINIPNVPFNHMSGARISRQDNEIYDEFFEKRRDPRNRIYYWQGGESQPEYRYADADGKLLSDNFISITPIRCDMTDYVAMEKLRNWDFENGCVKDRSLKHSG